MSAVFGARVAAALERLRRELGPALVAEIEQPARLERFGELSPSPMPPLAAALAAAGVGELWSHQVEALAAVRRGDDVLLTTATASGKSLVFQLPVLEAALAGERGRALFLFPLKALARDQLGKLRALAAAAGLDDGAALAAVYDGDTPAAERARVRRDPPRVLISNPDMIHLGMLPHAAAWQSLLADLRWIVIDELHTYRGIFGAHFHRVLGRLVRLARAAGAAPAIVAASATAAEADVFANALTGRDFVWVRESGAPQERKRFLLVRPPASPYTTALEVYAELVRAGLKTIVFTKARRITELLQTWLARRAPDVAERTRSYRAGYLPEERRDIERALAEGRLDGVISTSALEMGIDIGGLDACVLVGYPGSAMATLQRAGRVGRRERESIVVLVAQPDALDQYLVDHPAELVERPLERLIVDPDNEAVARDHLVCAAAELPLSPSSDGALLERFAPLVGELLAEGALARSAESDTIVSLALRPQRRVALRGVGGSFAIVDAGGRSVGKVDGARVLAECHPGAIYLHAGRQYSVRELDLENSLVRVERSDVDWYTTPRTEKETEILEVFAERREGSLRSGFGRLQVTERVVGFERRRTHAADAIDVQPLELPPAVYETQGLWFLAPPSAVRDSAATGANLLGALHASEHAAIGLFPLVALCDRSDLGGISLTSHPQLRQAGVFVYEGHVGGVGIAKRGFAALPELVERVAELLERCPCESGCPSCIQSPKCGNGNRPLDKAGALALLGQLLEDPRPVRPGDGTTIRTLAEMEGDGGVAGEKIPRKVRSSELGVEPEKLGIDDAVERHRHHGAGRSGGRLRLVPVSEGAARAADVEDFRDAAGLAAPTAATPRQVEPYVARIEPARPETTIPSTERSSFLSESRRGASATWSRRTVLFDIETLRSAAEVGGWDRAYKMGVAVAVALHLEEGRFESYFEADVVRLIEELKRADLVVGFNSLRFDYAVLSGYTGEDYSRHLRSLDLLHSLRGRLGFRVGLDHLAKETLGRGKSGDGLQSLEWVRQGRLDLVEQYCRVDVEVMRDVYLHGRREGYVVISRKRLGRIRVPVDW